MAKFCTSCGNPLPGDGSPCPNCLTEQPPAAPAAAPSSTVSQMPSVEIGQPLGGSAKLSFEDEEETVVNLGNFRIKAATIIKLVAIGLFILFFLPLFSVSCEGMKITFSGVNAAFGKTVSVFGTNERVNGNLIAIFLLLIPAALFCVFQFKKKLSFVSGKLFQISTGLAALGLLVCIILSSSVNKMAAENMMIAQFTFWYYLTIILYIGSGFISAWSVVLAKKKT